MASWCGPCIRQTTVIKDIYKEYGPKGLDVIGIAVWDEPENRCLWASVEKRYKRTGISRDKQNDALRQAVANAMDNTK